jgi:hypothetical protein
MHYFSSKDMPGLKIWNGTQPHLKRIREIVESRHRHTLENLFLGETQPSQPTYVLAAELGGTYSKFESEIQ